MATPAPAPPPYDPASERIRLLVNPPRICPWCCQEQNQPVPPGTTNAIVCAASPAGPAGGASMTGPELVAHFLTLAQQLPASAWESHPNPLLRWDIVRLVVGAYRVEVVQQRYGDYWRVQVFPAQTSPTSLLLLSAEGPQSAMRLTVMQPGSWPSVVLAALPLPVGQERRRYGWSV